MIWAAKKWHLQEEDQHVTRRRFRAKHAEVLGANLHHFVFMLETEKWKSYVFIAMVHLTPQIQKVNCIHSVLIAAVHKAVSYCEPLKQADSYLD